MDESVLAIDIEEEEYLKTKYAEKEQYLKTKFLKVAKDIKKIKLDENHLEDKKALVYFNALEKGVENFSCNFGYDPDKSVFEALLKVINAEAKNNMFIRNRCFSKTHHYLNNFKKVLNKCKDLNEVKLGSGIGASNLNNLVDVFRKYSHILSDGQERYKYIIKYKAENLGMLYYTWVDPELFTLLNEFHNRSYKEAKGLLLEKIKLKLEQSITKEDYIVDEKIKDYCNLFWALSTVLSNSKNGVIVKNLICSLNEFKNIILTLVEREIKYPSDSCLRFESTAEIYGKYRTRLYILKDLIDIYLYFSRPEERGEHEYFLQKVYRYVKTQAKDLFSDEECNAHSGNIYFLCLQLEVLYKFLKMERGENTASESRKRKKLKVNGKADKEEKLEYTIFLSRPSGVGAIRKEDTEESIQIQYMKKKDKYDIFIYGRTVYKKIRVKVKNETRENIIALDLDENVFRLLIIFLMYKDKPLSALKLYHKSWEGVGTHETEAKYSIQVMDDLKQAVSQLRASFEDIKNFYIPRACRISRAKKSSIYFLRGKFNFCVIIEKVYLDEYILQEV